MKINVDFKLLDVTRRTMGAKLLKLTDVHIEKTAFEILKSDDGIEVDSKDISISSDGTILHKQSDKPVLLYINL